MVPCLKRIHKQCTMLLFDWFLVKQQNGIIEKTPTSGKHAQSNHVIPITTVRENEEQLFLFII